MPDKTPQGHIAAFSPPGSWFSNKALDSSLAWFPSFPVIASIPVYHNLVVPTALDSRLAPFPGFPVSASIAVYPFPCCPHGRSPLGLPEFSDASLPACHGLWTPADLHILALSEASVLPSVYVKTLGVRNHSFRSCTSTSGRASPLRPTGFSVYASPVLFAALQRLRHGRKTRYGWVASPYPTGTFTPQETPSLSRRDND